MAAPSGTVWGSQVLSKDNGGRVGIYTSMSSTETTTTLNVEVWFWGKWTVSDKNNTLYYDNLASSGSATTSKGSVNIQTTDPNNAWSTTNQVKIASYSHSYTRSTSATTRFLYAKLINVDIVGSTMTVGTTVSIPKLSSYTISYNANGGSGAPSSQTKWYGIAITLSSTKPTRTGYTFQGWATSASGSVAYASGASYTANAKVTLYAVWKAHTYSVKYNANGGSGAPSNQTKTYGQALVLSRTVPTRTNYNFLGWSTSASSTTVTYAAGASYTNNAAITLYAVWELAYVKPIVYNLVIDRCDHTGVKSDEGLFGSIRFVWECTYSVTSIVIGWASTSYGSGSTTVAATGKNGTVDVVIGDGAFDPEASYTVTVTVTDSGGSSHFSTTLPGCIYSIDVKAGGKGIAFGKPAELNNSNSLGGLGVVDFAFDAKFNEPVYGNVLGLNKLPRIPANSDFNDYLTTGSWAVYMNTDAETIANMPCKVAGRLEVNSPTGTGVMSSGWSYIRQRFIPYSSSNATWERFLVRNDENVWEYNDWWQSSLTPKAAKRVYHEPKILWSGALYMQGSHTIKLSESVNDQPKGIVLIFSRYDTSASTAINNHMHSFFVPKTIVTTLPGVGHHFEMSYVNYSSLCDKYLNISPDEITGADENVASGTSSFTGIPYNNKAFVLRYVVGV